MSRRVCQLPAALIANNMYSCGLNWVVLLYAVSDDVQHWNFKQLLDESDSFPFGESTCRYEEILCIVAPLNLHVSVIRVSLAF